MEPEKSVVQVLLKWLTIFIMTEHTSEIHNKA